MPADYAPGSKKPQEYWLAVSLQSRLHQVGDGVRRLPEDCQSQRGCIVRRLAFRVHGERRYTSLMVCYLLWHPAQNLAKGLGPMCLRRAKIAMNLSAQQGLPELDFAVMQMV